MTDRTKQLDAIHELLGSIAFPGTPEERDECSLDHHGGCQAHGYLSLEPGETCPQQDAKDWARAALTATEPTK